MPKPNKRSYGPKIAEDKAVIIEEFCAKNLVSPNKIITAIVEKAAQHLKELL